jgi:hypothetical protein
MLAGDATDYFHFLTKNGEDCKIYKVITGTSVASLIGTVTPIPDTSLIWFNEAGLLEVTEAKVTNFYAISSGSATKQITRNYVYAGSPTFFAIPLQYGFVTGFYTGLDAGSNSSVTQIVPTTPGGTTYA